MQQAAEKFTRLADYWREHLRRRNEDPDYKIDPSPENKNQCCDHGFIKSDTFEQIKIRANKMKIEIGSKQFDTFHDSIMGKTHFFKRCPRCAAKALIAALSPNPDNPCSWEAWKHVDELSLAVKDLKSWRGGYYNWTMVICSSGMENNFGSGKTHALIATCADWILAGYQSFYVDAADMIESRRLSWDDKSMVDNRVESTRGLVAIDDLGKEANTPWTRETIDRIIDRRYRNRRPTLIASNLDQNSLVHRYPRSMSRISSGLVHEWNAPDRRRRVERTSGMV